MSVRSGGRGRGHMSRVMPPSFSPAALFTSGEAGFWGEVTLATVWQDSARTTAGVVGQPVGSWLLNTGSTAIYATASGTARPTLRQEGALLYLEFDGSNDTLATSTITPGSDKVQVVAGVRKTSDAAQAVLISTGSIGATNRLELFAPVSVSGNEYTMAVSASSTFVTASSGAIFASPVTSVVTGIGDVALTSGEAVIRVNGTQRGTSGGNAGTGNFSAQPVSIGSRGGGIPFNGRIYGLIVRFGANLSAGQITQAENWINQRTGAY